MITDLLGVVIITQALDEFHALQVTTKLLYRFHKRQQLFPVLSQIPHTIETTAFKIHLNNIIPSISWSSKQSFISFSPSVSWYTFRSYKSPHEGIR